jgi:hypothetical protein
MNGLLDNVYVFSKDKNIRSSVRNGISADIVKLMFGGEWPEFNGFDFESVDFFICEDGVLVPYHEIGGAPLPGPGIVLTMVDDLTPEESFLVVPDSFEGKIRFERDYQEGEKE